MATKAKKGTAGKSSLILAWDDDPGVGQALKPSRRSAPKLSALRLPVAITGGKPPAPSAYDVGTPNFRYWTAADALARGVELWSSLVPPKTRWQTKGKALPVHLNAGTDLNAFYTRGDGQDPPGLSFFEETVMGRPVFSGESPDVATHELGHAVLDAIRPELWDVATVEAAAFHESFGDMSAVLCTLQLESMRTLVLEETGGKVFRSSRASRLAEQLGWAVRQTNPGSAEPDCLRNAVNSFFYRDPTTLPPVAPASLLSSEPHSFSRVFTAAFVEMLSGIFMVLGKNGNEAQLQQASLDAGQLLVDSILEAPIVSSYYSQVAAHCVEADATRFKKKYRDVIKGAFVRRGILSVETAAKSLSASRHRSIRSGDDLTETRDRRVVQVRPVHSSHYGLDEQLFVTMPGGSRRFDVAPSKSDVGSIDAVTPDQAAGSFLEDLFRRGRINMEKAQGDPDAMLIQPFVKKTHVMRRDQGNLTLHRRMFDCGWD